MSYAGNSPANKPREESLLNVIRDFDTPINRLWKSAEHLRILSDRIEGTRPQDASSPVPDHPPHSTINEMQQKRQTLSLICDTLEAELQRLDAAIGSANEIKGTRIG